MFGFTSRFTRMQPWCGSCNLYWHELYERKATTLWKFSALSGSNGILSCCYKNKCLSTRMVVILWYSLETFVVPASCTPSFQCILSHCHQIWSQSPIIHVLAPTLWSFSRIFVPLRRWFLLQYLGPNDLFCGHQHTNILWFASHQW